MFIVNLSLLFSVLFLRFFSRTMSANASWLAEVGAEFAKSQQINLKH